MTARLVHSVMAAGLENPELIARWRDDPRLLAGRDGELAGLDLDGLRKFAGLAAKIRHNGVREKLPLSFRLMSVARMEIDVFAAYAEDRSRNGVRYAASVEDKTRDLVAFLGTWLDRGNPHHCLLWDLARHEQTLDALGQQPQGPPAPPTKVAASKAAKLAAATTPRIAGEIVLHEMSCEPSAVAACLYESRPRIDDLEIGQRLFCYWRPGEAGAIQILQLDAFGYYLLGLVDGLRSVADLSATLGCGRRPTRQFLQALRQMASCGVLRFDAGARARAR